MDEPLLKVRDLKAGYGKLEVLHGLNFDIKKGEIVSLIGHNGAGKTTAIKSIFGLIKINQGKVLLDNKDITNSPASRNVYKGNSFVPQSNNVFFGFSVEENLKLSTHVFKKHLSKEEINQRIAEVFDLFPNLSERKKQNANGLSGGQKQMLAIGMALMRKPKLLYLDEPSIGLAPILFQNVLDSLKIVNEKLGTSILLVEQNVKKALEVSDRAYVMKMGEIIKEIDSNDVNNNNNLWELF